MNQILPQRRSVEDFVNDIYIAWLVGRARNGRHLDALTRAISDICNKNRTACHDLPPPKVNNSTTGKTSFNKGTWQIDLEMITGLTDLNFVRIVTLVFNELCYAEIKWYEVLDKVKNNLNVSLAHLQMNGGEPLHIYERAYSHIKRVGSHSITPNTGLQKPQKIEQIVSDRARVWGIGRAPTFLPKIITSPAGSPMEPSSAIADDSSLALSKPCFSKKEFRKETLAGTLSMWSALRDQPIMGTMKEWKHIVHMDHRILLDPDRPNRISPAKSAGLLVNGRFPDNWKKISASLISNEMPNWTFLYRRYYDGSNHGGGLRVGYILDVPSQNILSTSPEDVASVDSERYMENCMLHPYGSECDIACYVRHNTAGKLGWYHPHAIYALTDLLNPNALLAVTRICPNRRRYQEYHHNEMLIMCRNGTNRMQVYEDMAPIGDVKAKAVYLVIDDRDTLPDINYRGQNHCDEMRHDVTWAEKMAIKHNLPIFQVRINEKGKVYESIYRLPSEAAIDKVRGPYFKYLDTATNTTIKDNLSKWDDVCNAEVKDKESGPWQYIVHMDSRVTTKDKPLLVSGKFPSNWKKISASLVTEKTADWTFLGDTIHAGYILDVPSQNILSTNSENIFSYESERHIATCSKKHKSGGCHILCYIEANAKRNGGELNALDKILSPDELLKEQVATNAKSHNELVILGPGTPNRVLYEGVPRTSEVKVKGGVIHEAGTRKLMNLYMT